MEIDEDEYRDLILTWIRLNVRESIDHFLALKMELALLSQGAAVHAEEDKRMEGMNSTTGLKTTTITSSDVRNLQGPIVFDGKKQEFIRQVFQPGYSQPTMTMDEFIEIERQRGNIITGGGKVPIPIDQDDAKMTELEAQQDTDDEEYWKEKRREDEWKEGINDLLK